MTLQLDADVRPAEDADQLIDEPADAVALGGQRLPADQRDQSGGVTIEILQRERRFALRRTQFRAGNDSAQIAIALRTRDQHW